MDFIPDAINFIKLAWNFLPVLICFGLTIFALIKYNRNGVLSMRIKHPNLTPSQINSAIAIIGLLAIFIFWPNNHGRETDQGFNQEYSWDSQ